MSSIICAVMNREPALRISLASWLPRVDEIIIVDWSSDPPLEIEDVTIIRVESEKTFHKTAASNLALDFVTHDTVMQMDAEHVLSPYYDIFDLPEPNGFFYWGGDKDGCLYHEGLTGFLYVRTEDLRNINGYNEHMIDCRYEDQDVFKRLTASGLERRVLPQKKEYILHLPHPNSVRVENYQNKDMQAVRTANKELSTSMPKPERVFNWEIL